MKEIVLAVEAYRALLDKYETSSVCIAYSDLEISKLAIANAVLLQLGVPVNPSIKASADFGHLRHGIKNPYKSVAWQKRKRLILERAKYQCERCGKVPNFSLSVHHKRYIDGHRIHEYPDDLLVALCNGCHRFAHSNSGIKEGLFTK